MRATIEDPNALMAISPQGLIAYVTSEGWKRTTSYGQHSDIYERDGHREIILPGTDAIGDYPTVVADLLQFMAKEQHRDELQIYRDLLGSDRDVVRVRALQADDDGSVSIDAGVQLVLQSRDMLQAAACAAKEPRAAYRAGRIKDAANYMERVRLGQTERGSFVITLLAPVPPALNTPDQGSLWPLEPDEPFDRKVTRTLAGSLEAASRAAESAVRGNGMSAFTRVVPEGVNANLCDALSALIMKGCGLEVSVTWAKTRPTNEPRRVVKFSEAEGEIFQEAARLFRSMEPRPDEQLEAFVVALDRAPEAGEGRVTLRTFLDGQPTSVRASLNPKLYHEAISAHDNRQSIVLIGDLRRQGQRWFLDNPRNMQVVAKDEQED